MARESDHSERGTDWSVLDVEDLRDFAKTMTIDELTTVMARSRHDIQRKLIELGLTAVKDASNETAES
jgi:hypothetical protein